MPEETTTIEITRSDRDRLNHLRRYPREPYRTVVRRLLDRGEDAEPLSPETIADIQASLDDIRRGEFVAHEELKRDPGVLSEVLARLLKEGPAQAQTPPREAVVRIIRALELLGQLPRHLRAHLRPRAPPPPRRPELA